MLTEGHEPSGTDMVGGFILEIPWKTTAPLIYKPEIKIMTSKEYLKRFLKTTGSFSINLKMNSMESKHFYYLKHRYFKY